MAEQHYDNLRQPTHPRRDGPSFALKDFHNQQKRDLLTKFAPPNATILDIACGRGGDVWKYKDLGVTRVVGLDISTRELEEATRRAARACVPCVYRRQDARMEFDLHETFDVVTCMFAMHYFFETEDTARTLFKNVARHLIDGGTFVGIVPDGRCVRDAETAVMTIETFYETPECFGSEYTMSVRDTVTENSSVHEYLVFSNVLEKLAREHGLTPLDIPWLTRMHGRVLWHFDPPYGGDMRECTNVYAAFAFKKESPPS